MTLQVRAGDDRRWAEGLSPGLGCWLDGLTGGLVEGLGGGLVEGLGGIDCFDGQVGFQQRGRALGVFNGYIVGNISFGDISFTFPSL